MQKKIARLNMHTVKINSFDIYYFMFKIENSNIY